MGFIHYHSLRNNLYHEGKNLVPTERDVQGARETALYVFSTLFNVNGEELLKSTPTLHTPPRPLKFQGSGGDIYKVPLKVGPAIFRITYKGQSWHSCELCNEDDDDVAQLIKIFEGTPKGIISVHKYNKTTNIKIEGVYILKVHASSGTWQIEVE